MKRIIFIVIIAMIPSAVFAQLQLGPTAFYNFRLNPVEDIEDGDSIDWDVSNFTFGADARLTLGPFQAQAFGLFTPASGDTVDPVHVLDVHTTAGLAVDIAILRITGGFGPSFSFEFGDGATESAGIGTNARLGAEVGIGDIAVGLNYLMRFPFDLEDSDRFWNADKSRGYIGASVLFGF